MTPDPNCPLLSGELGGMLATTCEIPKLIFDFKLEENSRVPKIASYPCALHLIMRGTKFIEIRCWGYGQLSWGEDQVAEDVLPRAQNGLATSSHEIRMRGSIKFFQSLNPR